MIGLLFEDVSLKLVLVLLLLFYFYGLFSLFVDTYLL